MAQVIDSVSSAFAGSFTCCYLNASSKIQVVRVTNVPNWYFERVVFPGQRLIFEAPSIALLEVHCGMMASSILSDTIPCERLRISDDEVAPFELSLKQGSSIGMLASEVDEQVDSQPKVRELAVTTSVAS